MKRLILIYMGIIIFLLTCTFIYAKRTSPKTVDKIIHKGIEYRAPHNIMGCVEAWYIETGVRIWWKQIYLVKYNPKLETDVQDVFIYKMKTKDNNLIIENEKGYIYSLDLTSLEVKTLKGKGIIQHGS